MNGTRIAHKMSVTICYSHGFPVQALEAAIERDKALSQTLSINFADMMGISAGDDYAEDGSNHGKTKTKLFARNK